jgi:hypothetical protein
MAKPIIHYWRTFTRLPVMTKASIAPEFVVVEEQPDQFTLRWTCRCGLKYEKDISYAVREAVGLGQNFVDVHRVCHGWDPVAGKNVGCARSYTIVVHAKLRVNVTTSKDFT